MILRTAVLCVALLLAACTSPGLKPREPVSDNQINGTWEIKTAEFGGKRISRLPGFILEIAGNRYRGGTGPQLDTGSLVFYGDEVAGK